MERFIKRETEEIAMKDETSLKTIYVHPKTKYDIRSRKAWLSEQLQMPLTDDAFIAYLMEKVFNDKVQNV